MNGLPAGLPPLEPDGTALAHGARLAIIGGSGLARLDTLRDARALPLDTPWGAPSDAPLLGMLDGVPVVFLARHGAGHAIPPHRINQRANLWALRRCGVRAVLSVATVGGLADDCGPGRIVVPDQIVDYTHGRPSTYFDDGLPVTHVDFTQPYDAALRARLLRVAGSRGEALRDGGTYGCTQGPRLETAAEVARMRRDGCDLVGMTGMPEAVLARELALPYVALCVVVNHAAGIADSREAISLEAVARTMEAAMERVRGLLAAFARDVGHGPVDEAGTPAVAGPASTDADPTEGGRP